MSDDGRRSPTVPKTPNEAAMAAIATRIEAALASSDEMPAGAAPSSVMPDPAERRADLDAALEASNTGALTEDGQALSFAAQNDDLRYVAAWRRWMIWRDGMVWRPEKTLAVFDRIRKQVRAATQDIKPGLRTRLRSARTIAAIEMLARSDRRFAATAEQWDCGDMILNTSGGVADLRTGTIMAWRADDYCTKITAAGPAGECPKWMAFLEKIFTADHELIDYIQKVFGYCLTGSIREHALFFGFGTGGNGKSVLLTTASKIFGDYARTAPIETFIATYQAGHPTDLAGLAGARLVSCTETEEGRKWAESKIKALTGGDVVTARFMRQDFFDFVPTFKLFIAGNHKPGLRGVDESIRRRFHLIPFLVSIPEADQDKRLSEKLQQEWPGIPAWMIEGARKWVEEGLDRPMAVRQATDQYLEAEDTLASWIEDRCELGANFRAPRGALFASWKGWAERAGEFVGTQRQFYERLESRGFEASKIEGERLFKGLRLKPIEEEKPCDLYG